MRIILLIVCFFPGVLFSQVELNLQLCRDMAVQNSEEMVIASRRQQKATLEVNLVRADFAPKLSVVGLGFYNHKKYSYKVKGDYLPTYKPGEGGHLEPNVMLDPETHRPVTDAQGNPVFNEYAFLPDIRLKLSLRGVYSAGVQLEQPIYMGGKVKTAFRMAKVGERIATDNIRYNRSEVLLETDQAYWKLLEVGEQVIAAEKYRDVVAELVKNLQNARQVGMAAENEVLKAQVRLNEAELMLQKARNGKTLAGMNLCRLTGLDLQTEVNVRDTLTDYVDPRIWNLDTALSQRPDYSMLMQEVDLKGQQVAFTRSDYLPQLGVSAGYGYSGGLKLNGQDEADATFSAMAALKIPVFHWGEGRNKVRSATLEKEISHLELERSAKWMRLEIASGRFQLKDAQSRVNLANSTLKQAEQNLKVSQDQYQVGMENLTSLLEAQAQWQEAWSQWIAAKGELHLAESTYLKAIGKLE